MPVIKCKMCGGDLNLTEGSTVCECEYCGTKQTVPSMDNEKKLTLFARAGRLLRACEFDKAAGVFETIVADFPEEAEAYWGLVLCKYGIEYVDDPATGKKIPTCHRSSFDSVLDDANFEQACENTDALARRVYRDEARQIEALRQAILQVSGREEPYDVFISYKETNANGERTLDSVIAQDIYKELTNEGYRVFFSRISLEDKLGTEYEPYIFAALNSAKVMLVVGTDYENFDAVWVKNEWSRFLKLIARGEKKTLIPVFKNMDAYDMPKEFAKLAAQDMGKVGAMQDLVRGVGKIVGSKKEEAAQALPMQQVVQQTVVQGGGPNISAMIERGHQALEDGEWAKADEFFDQALNMDARCAEAFMGKFLAQEKALSLDAALDQHLAECDRSVKTEQKKLEENTAFRDKLAEKYEIPGYLERPVIEDKLRYDDLFYSSTVASREAMQRGAMEKLNSDKLLSRAKRYAASDTVQRIYAAVKSFEQQLAARTQKAQAEEAENRQRKQAKYNAFLDVTEKEIIDLHEQRAAKQERDYQEACKLMADAETIRDYEHAATKLKSTGLKHYKDSAELVAQCREGISNLIDQERQRKEEEKQRIEAEKKAYAEKVERQRIESKKAEAARKQRLTLTLILVAILSVAGYFTYTRVIVPANSYKEAKALYEAGQYEQAYAEFVKLKGYKDVDSLLEKDEYLIAAAAARKAAFTTIGNTVRFGTYEQDNNTANGKEAIEWVVLATEGDRSLLISKYALDCQQYNKYYTSVTWETSTPRKWLNDTFLNAAFSAEEKAIIPTVTVSADKNPGYSTSPGNSTMDQVFLLSITEVNKYFMSDNARRCQGTAYCYAQGAYKNYYGFCQWWLRSPGYNSTHAAHVCGDGSVNASGDNVGNGIAAVRPALWITLD